MSTISKPRAIALGACVAVALSLLILRGPNIAATGVNTFGGQASVTTSAQSITTLLSLSPHRLARQLSIRIDPASGNTVYAGPSTVTNVPANARVVISVAGTPGYTWQPGAAVVDTDDIYLVGSGSTTVFIDGIE